MKFEDFKMNSVVWCVSENMHIYPLMVLNTVETIKRSSGHETVVRKEVEFIQLYEDGESYTVEDYDHVFSDYFDNPDDAWNRMLSYGADYYEDKLIEFKR